MPTEFITTFFVLAIGGLADAGYLIFKHRVHEPLACPLDHDCSVVTESKWARLFGVRNEILGFFFYGGLLVGMLIILFVPAYEGLVRNLILIGVSIGLVLSAFLILIQLAVIKDYCFYCLISAGLNVLLFVNALSLFW